MKKKYSLTHFSILLFYFGVILNMPKEVKLIPFSIAIQTLMLNQNTFYSLIKDKKIKIFKNNNLDDCTLESDLKILCYNEKVKNISKICLLKSLLSLESDKKNKKDVILIH